MDCSHLWHLAEFRDTWTFVNRRIKDALDLQKTFQEVGHPVPKLHHHPSYFVMCHVASLVSSIDLLNQTIPSQAAYLAEAVGAGMGGTVQGVLNRVFQNRGS
jgi:hypothetical protein